MNLALIPCKSSGLNIPKNNAELLWLREQSFKSPISISEPLPVICYEEQDFFFPTNFCVYLS